MARRQKSRAIAEDKPIKARRVERKSKPPELAKIERELRKMKKLRDVQRRRERKRKEIERIGADLSKIIRGQEKKAQRAYIRAQIIELNSRIKNIEESRKEIAKKLGKSMARDKKIVAAIDELISAGIKPTAEHTAFKEQSMSRARMLWDFTRKKEELEKRREKLKKELKKLS